MQKLPVYVMASLFILLSGIAMAQQYEKLSASVQAGLSAAISDTGVTNPSFISEAEANAWLHEKSAELSSRIPDQNERTILLSTIYYEARRAGLDPELVLAIIDTESHFRKYAISAEGARGYMQIMEFWVRQIGNPKDNLFHLRTNLRYGCTIFRHYLDKEQGNIILALGRYHGSRGKSTYPNRVLAAWEKWYSAYQNNVSDD